jgi:hypothetical protein
MKITLNPRAWRKSGAVGRQWGATAAAVARRGRGGAAAASAWRGKGGREGGAARRGAERTAAAARDEEKEVSSAYAVTYFR